MHLCNIRAKFCKFLLSLAQCKRILLFYGFTTLTLGLSEPRTLDPLDSAVLPSFDNAIVPGLRCTTQRPAPPFGPLADLPKSGDETPGNQTLARPSGVQLCTSDYITLVLPSASYFLFQLRRLFHLALPAAWSSRNSDVRAQLCASPSRGTIHPGPVTQNPALHSPGPWPLNTQSPPKSAFSRLKWHLKRT